MGLLLTYLCFSALCGIAFAAYGWKISDTYKLDWFLFGAACWPLFLCLGALLFLFTVIVVIVSFFTNKE